MEFKHLKAAIMHNAEEEPSIYLAICAMQSLVDDIEDEAEEYISQCPLGDEKLPTRLLWLCNTVLDIYNDNSEDMIRNRERLHDKTQELSGIAQKLEELSDISEQLALKQKESEDKAQKLSIAQAQKAQFDRLCKEVSAAEAQLSALKAVDVAAQQEKLTGLNRDILTYQTEQQKLQSELTAANANLQNVRQTCETRQRQLNEIQKDITELGPKALSLQAEIEAGTKTKELAAEKEAELTAEKDRLVQENSTQQAKLQKLREENERYKAEHIMPLLAQAEAEQQFLNEKESEKEQANQALEQIRQAKRQIVQDIAGIRAQEPTEKADLEKKRAQLIALRTEQTKRLAELDERKEQYHDLVGKLSELQNQAYQLEKNDIPAQQQLTDAEQARVTDLQSQLTQLEKDGKQAQQQGSDIEAKMQKATENLNTYQRYYENLTADYRSKNKEIDDLKSKLDEMKNKTDAEKHALYKKELEDAIRENTEIQSDCARLEKEIQENRNQSESYRNQYETLKNQKVEAEKVASDFKHYVEELKPIVTPSFQSELQKTKERLDRLADWRNSLEKNIRIIKEILGETPAANEPLPTQLNETLPKLQSELKQIQNDLKKCAESITLEERA